MRFNSSYWCVCVCVFVCVCVCVERLQHLTEQEEQQRDVHRVTVLHKQQVCVCVCVCVYVCVHLTFMWCTGMSGLPCSRASSWAWFSPTRREADRPGLFVTAIASTSDAPSRAAASAPSTTPATRTCIIAQRQNPTGKAALSSGSGISVCHPWSHSFWFEMMSQVPTVMLFDLHPRIREIDNSRYPRV